MFFDSLTLAAILAEIRNEYLGLPLVQVRHSAPLTFRLAFQPPAGDWLWLEISAEAKFARIHPVRNERAAPRRPRSFAPSEIPGVQSALQSLIGTTLDDAEQERFDRLFRLRFRAPLGAETRWWALWGELMGRHANLILVGPDGNVVEALKRIGQPADRVIWPQHPYKLPATDGRHSILAATEENVTRMCGKWPDLPVAKALAKTFFGVSDRLLAYWAKQGGLELEQAAAGQELLIWGCIKSLQNLLETESFQPHRQPEVGFWPLPYPNALPCESVGWAAAEHYGIAAFEAVLEAAKKQAITPLTARAKKLETLRKTLEKQMLEDAADRSQQLGEILLSNLHLVPEKTARVALPDLYASDTQEVSISLQPNLTPQENAQRYFKLAKKAKSRLEHNARRLEEIQRDIAQLKERASAILAAQTLESLKQHLPTPKQQASKEHQDKELQELNRLGVRRTVSQDGYVILYGRNAQGNEHLTKAIAKPTDWWLHARAVTGSHVVIQTKNAPEKVPMRTIEEAAKIAAQNSEAKHASLLAVDYTLRKYVRKAKGGKLGLVLYEREKTVHVIQGENK